MIVLDASALLALMFREPGHQRVATALTSACMSTVNLAEVLSRFTRDGHAIGDMLEQLQASTIEWVPFTDRLAAATAELAPTTRQHGLSLGDRACLALAMTRGCPALTADRLWTKIEIGVSIEVIR